MEQVMKLLIILLGIRGGFCTWYKVLLISGWAEPGFTMELLRDGIEENYPQTKPQTLTPFLGFTPSTTFDCMWDMVEEYKKVLLPIMNENPQGVILVAHSQGGLVARALAESIPNHRIVKIITLGSPHMGVAALPGLDQTIGRLYDVVRSMGYGEALDGVQTCKVLYPIQCQDALAGYWREPGCLDDYRKYCKFLPLLNNEVEHPRSEDFKNNFLMLSKLILITSNTDDMIIPWQSAHFGTRLIDSPDSPIIPMTQQEVYQKDSFGLQTLDQRGGIILYRADGCGHVPYLFNKTVWKLFVYPNLI